MKSLTTTLLLSITAIASAETVVHHGIVGHFENIGPCPAHLMVPKCEDKAKWCEHLQMCTKPEGHCSRDGKGCVDIRFNRDVCVKPYNAYPGGYCGRCTHHYELLFFIDETCFGGIHILHVFNVLAQNQVRGNLKIANMTNMGMASVTKLNLSLIMIMDFKRGCTGVRKQFVFIAQ